MAECKITVSLQAGNVVGRQSTLPNGEDWYIFKGIPYAQPPIGCLRFQPPVALTKLPSDPLECFIDGPSSHCDDVRSERPSEDCLYLNVFSKELHPETPLPVMVWIHGGGFFNGTGHSALYEPPYLVQQGAVVVSINYRLGPLGFLAMPSVGIAGNMGLKDQRMSLRWVAENIRHFGGDPNNVTIFGESAGGASVHLHYLSEDSRQYFHRAIAQSGTAFNEWVWQRDATERARNLARLLGATGDRDEDVLTTLMAASAQEMTSLQYPAMGERDRKVLMRFPFTPVIERAESADAIITEHPARQGEKVFRKEIPLLMGSTDDEGLGLWSLLHEKLSNLESDPSLLIPATLDVRNESDERCASEMIGKFFFPTRPISHETMRSVTTILGDNLNTLPQYVAAELHARSQSAPLYLYVFSFVGELNKFREEAKVPAEHLGACHADDIYYLFSSPYFNTAAVADNSEAGKFRSYMCKLWVHFARHGHPNVTGNSEWEPVVRSDVGHDAFFPSAMNLGAVDGNTMTTEFFFQRYQFWKQLYQKFNTTHLLPRVE